MPEKCEANFSFHFWSAPTCAPGDGEPVEPGDVTVAGDERVAETLVWPPATDAVAPGNLLNPHAVRPATIPRAPTAATIRALTGTSPLCPDSLGIL